MGRPVIIGMVRAVVVPVVHRVLPVEPGEVGGERPEGEMGATVPPAEESASEDFGGAPDDDIPF